MASIRLNKEIRKIIADNISEAYVKNNPAPTYKTSEDFKKDFEDFVKQYYINKGNAILALAKTINLDKYLKTTHYINIYNDNNFVFSVYLDESNTRYTVIDPETSNLNLNAKEHKAVLKEYEKYKQNIKGLKPLLDAYKAWQLKHDNYMSEVSNVLAGVNTTGQLLEVWPECAGYIPQGIRNPSKIQLPVVSIAALNSAIQPTSTNP